MPTPCQTCESCRASPASARRAVPGSQGPLFRGDTEAQRGDSWACWRLPAQQRQQAEASGSWHEQGICP